MARRRFTCWTPRFILGIWSEKELIIEELMEVNWSYLRKLLKVGDEADDVAADGLAGDAGRAALVARHFAGFARVEMVLAAFFLQNLFILRDAKAFGDRLLGFEFWHRVNRIGELIEIRKG